MLISLQTSVFAIQYTFSSYGTHTWFIPCHSWNEDGYWTHRIGVFVVVFECGRMVLWPWNKMYWAGTWPQCADKRSDVAWIIFQLHPLPPTLHPLPPLPPTPAHVMRGRGASPHIARFGLVLLHNPYLTSSEPQMIARLQKTDQWQCTGKWVFVSKLKGQVRSLLFIGSRFLSAPN